MAATINMMPRVLGDEAALWMVKLLAGVGFEVTRFGKRPIPNRKTNAATVAHEETNA